MVMLGGPRHRVVDRLDKGIKRKAQDEELHDISEGGSIAGWLRKRREAVDKAVSLDCSHLDFDAAEFENTSEWTEGHTTEKSFQKDEQEKQLMEAFQYGALAEEDIGDDLQQKVEERKAKDKKLDQEHVAKQKRIAKATNRPNMTKKWSDFSGNHYWAPENSLREEIMRQLEAHNVLRTNDPWMANIYIVPDAVEPPERVHWHAALHGKIVMDRSAVLGRGLLLHYKRALSKSLKLFITDQFKTDHEDVYLLIRRCLHYI